MRIYESITPVERDTSVALGFFDGLHRGHAAVLLAAVEGRRKGLVPAVFTFSASPQRELCGRGAPRLMTVSQKERALGAFGFELLYRVDFSALMEMEADAFVREVLAGAFRARRVCCGFNYRFGKGGSAGCAELSRLCAPYGIEVCALPPVLEEGAPISSTRIRALLEEGRVEEAERMLGRPFGFDFTVVHGRRIGRLMGTPTLNQPFPEDFVLPRFGVYASRVEWEGKSYVGVTNVGVKPTVGADAPLAETWMPDYRGEELYGCAVQTELLRYLRPETKFEDLDALRAAILADGRRAKELAAERDGR